ncbi:MAG: DNA mismatch repair protein MutS [Candidatus Dadabacteria bacterium]|nr:MAG: DNA mismatch repair protein MutS [Candidatus Dadabacteria bacterium]
MGGESSSNKPAAGAVVLPVDGLLDLHQFAPADIPAVVPAYLEACREKGILEVRIVHGKGRGILRRGLLALLERLPEVVAVRPAGPGRGSWGAVIVTMRPAPRA